jgi:glycosyltransferase involved in cell wall biosynthesis
MDRGSMLWGIFSAILLPHLKTVCTVHGLPEYPHSRLRRFRYRLSSLLYYIILQFCINTVICVSADLSNCCRRIIPRRKLKVIHNGLDLSNQPRHNANNLPVNLKRVVGTVCRLDVVKGISFFIEAARKVLDESDENLDFLIVGKGPMEKELKDLTSRLGLDGKIHFLGHRDDALEIMAGFDVFVLSSLHEGIPYVLLEAMSQSKPIASTDVGGISEVLRNGWDGVLVEPGNPTALAEAISGLLRDQNRASMLGKKARETVEKRFSSVVMANRMYGIYKELNKTS